MNQRRVPLVERLSKRLALGVLMALLVPVLLAAPAAAAPLTDLTGETFGPGAFSTSHSCQTDSAKFVYTVSGPAFGPYPGTYAETGTIVLGPGDNAGSRRTVTSFHADFTITSGAGTVVGKKTLRDDPTNSGTCLQVAGHAPHVLVNLAADYDATIGGTVEDEGTSHVTFSILSLGAPAFFETFTSAEDIEEGDEDDGDQAGD